MHAESTTLEFKALGPMEVSRDGERLLLRATIQRRLLAALLSGAGRPVAVESLVEAVWSDPPPDNVRGSLMVHMHRLRRGIGDPARIAHGAGGYSIRAAADEFDVKAFDELSAAARRARAEDELERSISLFTEATRLWRGAPYEDIPASGLIAREVHRLEQERVLVRQELLEISLDLGRHDSMIGELEALTREHPFRERLTALHMLALYRTGRQAEALQVFHESRATLREEMGIDPGAALQRIHEAILRRDEHLGFVAAGSLGGEWEPLARRHREVSVPAPLEPRELPADVNEFTGREGVLEELEAARLGNPEEGIPPSKVVVIAGTAGMGKTSAAVHWAHRIAGDYPDGQLFVNLHGFSAVPRLRSSEALAAMLRSLGLHRDQIPTAPDEAAARLRTETAGRRMLILLDNAASAEQVVPLLPGGSRSLVIVTSRNRLGDLIVRCGGYLLRLEPLTAAESERLLKTLLRVPRSAERPEIAELARRCGHLPLALRIAAASLTDQPDLGLAEYTKRLEEGSRVSTLRIGDSPYTAMRATFDRSYTRLPEAVRSVFRLMGAAPVRSFSVESVAVLAGTAAADAERAIEHLMNAHMLDGDHRGRYHLHDLIRAYADDLLGDEDPERSAALQRLFDWYTATADAAVGHRYKGHARLVEPSPRPGGVADDPERAGRWLEEESENLMAVARYAADSRGHGSVAWRLADILRGYVWAESSAADCIELGRAALQGALREESPRGEAVAVLTLATAYHRDRNYAQVAEHAERAIDLARRIGWEVGRASAHHLMSIACALIGRPRDAVGHADAALAMNRAAGRLRAQSVNLGALAMARGKLGELREKMRLHAEGLDVAEAIGSRALQASHLRDMASTAVERGRLDDAGKYLDRVARIDVAVGGGALQPATLAVMAERHSALGAYDAALCCAEAAAREAQRQGDGTHLALGLVQSARALNALGRHKEAVAAADRAIAATGPDRSEEMIIALVVRALGYIGLGEPAAVEADAELMLGLAGTGEYRVAKGLVLNVLAEADVRGGGSRRGAESAREALDILASVGHRLGEAWSLWLLGAAARAGGDRAAAARFRHRALQVHREIGAPIPARFGTEAE